MFKSITFRGVVTVVLSGTLFFGCFAPMAAYASDEDNPKTEANSEETSFMLEPEQSDEYNNTDEEVAELVSMINNQHLTVDESEENNPRTEANSEEASFMPESGQSDKYNNLREKVISLVDIIDNQPMKNRDKWLFMKTLQNAITWANVEIPRLTQFLEHNFLLDEKEDETASLFSSFYPNKQMKMSYVEHLQIAMFWADINVPVTKSLEEKLHEKARELASIIDDQCPDSQNAFAKQNLYEAFVWANASIKKTVLTPKS